MKNVGSLSVIIPTFREAENIIPLIERFSGVDFEGRQLEILFVDDNSQDGIKEVIHSLANNHHWVKLIERKAKRSLSLSVIEGCYAAQYPTIVVMDADLSHPPEKIPEMLQALSCPDVDFVIGSRYVQNGSIAEEWPIPRRITSKLAAIAAQLLLANRVKDPLSGFFCFEKAKLLSADKLNPIGWKIGLELMIKCRARVIKEIPIHFSHRFLGKSKLTYKVIFSYLHHLAVLTLSNFRRSL